MPWKETCTMDERLGFIADCLEGGLPMTVLCEAYGISRKTGYKWLSRYGAEGLDGLRERSRAPLHPGHGRAGSETALHTWARAEAALAAYPTPALP